jgi:outer membrane protein assembly factor BamB
MIDGTVSAGGAPAEGVRMSDGTTVATTDARGRYELPGTGPFVFVVRPTGWTARSWWARADGGATHDFALVADEQSVPFSFVQVTDIHVNGHEVDPGDTTARLMNLTEAAVLQEFLERVPGRVPDAAFVVATGDLTNHGLDDEYELLEQALDASPLPVHTAAGNHDHMNGVHEFTVSRHGYFVNSADPAAYERHRGPRWYSFDHAGVHFVVIDWHTWELGLDHEQQESWLRADLAATVPDAPWVLLAHDQLPTPFFASLPRAPVATFSGHWHTSRVVDVAGTRHVNTPNTFFAGLDYHPPAFRVATWDGRQVALDLVTVAPLPRVAPSPRRVRWTHDTGGSVLRARPIVCDGMVFVTAADDSAAAGIVDALDVERGEPVWRARVGAPVKAAAVVLDETVVVADVRGDVHGLDRATGATRWSVVTPEPLRHWGFTRPATDGTTVFVGDQTCFRAIDVVTGAVRWLRDDLGPHMNLTSHAAPVLAAGAVVVGFWPLPPALVALDPATGATLRDFRLVSGSALGGLSGPSPVGDPAVSPDGTDLYVPSGQGTSRVDAATFALRWTSPAPGIFNPATPVVTPHGIVVTVAEEGVRMLDPDDGAVRWVATFDAVGPFPMSCYGKEPHLLLAEAAVWRDGLVLAALDGRVRVLDAVTGSVLDVADVGAPIASPPAVVDDAAIVVGMDGTVVAVTLGGEAR